MPADGFTIREADEPEPQPLFRPIPSSEPFPTAELGGDLAAAAEAIRLRTQAPGALAAQSALGAAALAVQHLADVALPTGEQKPCSLFLLTIADSGERKSACDTWALRGVRERESALLEEYERELPAWRNRKEAWDKARSEALSKSKDYPAKVAALGTLGPEPPEPLSPMVVVTEPTLEGLEKLYARGRPSMGLFAAEGGGFLGGHGMSEDAKARTAAGLSNLWDGTPLRRVRSGDGATVLPGRRLASHLMTQPAIAALLIRDRMIAGAGGQGLVNRFLTIAPESTVGTRLFRDPPAETESTLTFFATRVRDLLAEPSGMAPGKHNELAPRALPLSAAARSDWIGFQHATEKAMCKGGALESVRGFGNKLAEHAARIAAVLTLFADPSAGEISAAAMVAGIMLAEHYASEAVRLAETAEIAAELHLAERTRQWLLHTWPEPAISLPDLYQRGPGAIRDRETAASVASILRDHGHLIEAKSSLKINGRLRREAWHIVGKRVAP